MKASDIEVKDSYVLMYTEDDLNIMTLMEINLLEKIYI